MSECHKVYFGNEHEIQKCSCSDWAKTGYMCKHFFAVFEKYTSWSINALLSIYINSPFLNLGKTDPFIETSTIPDATLTKFFLKEPDEINENTAINVQPLPSQDRWKAATAAIFRKYLKEVKDLSYIVKNLGDALGYLQTLSNPWEKDNKRFLSFQVKNKRKKCIYRENWKSINYLMWK